MLNPSAYRILKAFALSAVRRVFFGREVTDKDASSQQSGERGELNGQRQAAEKEVRDAVDSIRNRIEELSDSITNIDELQSPIDEIREFVKRDDVQQLLRKETRNRLQGIARRFYKDRDITEPQKAYEYVRRALDKTKLSFYTVPSAASDARSKAQDFFGDALDKSSDTKSRLVERFLNRGGVGGTAIASVLTTVGLGVTTVVSPGAIPWIDLNQPVVVERPNGPSDIGPTGPTTPAAGGETPLIITREAIIDGNSAQFKFNSNVLGADIECNLDDPAEWYPCGRAKTYPALTEGEHTFQVRVQAPGGSAENEPWTHKWNVPPEPTILVKPHLMYAIVTTQTIIGKSATFSFLSSDEEVIDFECSLDEGRWESCESPKTYPNLNQGEHRFEVRTVVDPERSSASWTVDTIDPDTRITDFAHEDRSAKVSFVSDENGVAFQCKRDNQEWKPCESSESYGDLLAGMHTLQVRAVDAAGNGDFSPATRSWPFPPLTAITDVEIAPSYAKFEFSDSDNVPRKTKCKLDDGVWEGCTSPKDYKFQDEGVRTQHTFQVHALVGSETGIPATYAWVVDTKPKQITTPP